MMKTNRTRSLAAAGRTAVATKLRDIVFERVRSGIWHMTHPELLPSIVGARAILAGPPIDEHWNHSGWPSYVRRVLGGVSVFDFSGTQWRGHSWDWAIPWPNYWDRALWLRVDPQVLGDRFISVDALESMCSEHCINTWVSGGKSALQSISIIDIGVEAACLGDVGIDAISDAFVVDANGVEDFYFQGVNA